MTNLKKIKAEAIERKLREPLAHIQKWVTGLIHEVGKAPGYNPGEKQVALMNLSKIDSELQVAKLIMKDDVLPFLLSEIDRAMTEMVGKVTEIVKAEEYLWCTAATGNKFSNFTNKEREQIKSMLLQKLSTLKKK